MPNVADHLQQQHPLGLPEPSYARQVLTTMAAELERARNRRALLTPVAIRRAYTVAVAARLHTLPTPVADDVAEKVAARLPDPGADATHGTYAHQLRQLAEAMR